MCALKNLEYSNLTKEDLRDMLNDESNELNNLISCMRKFNANIVGRERN